MVNVLDGVTEARRSAALLKQDGRVAIAADMTRRKRRTACRTA